MGGETDKLIRSNYTGNPICCPLCKKPMEDKNVVELELEIHDDTGLCDVASRLHCKPCSLTFYINFDFI